MKFFIFSILLLSLSITALCNVESIEIKSIAEVIKENEALRIENDRLRNWFDDVTKNITELQGNIFISTFISNVSVFTIETNIIHRVLNVILDS